MNEELEERLLEFMDKALNGIDASVDFMSEQLPDYINQLLVWYAVYGGIKFALGLVFVGTIYYVYKFASKMLGEGEFEAFACTALYSFITILISVKELINLEWLQILIAPKVWLVEYIGKLAG